MKWRVVIDWVVKIARAIVAGRQAGLYKKGQGPGGTTIRGPKDGV